MDISIDMLYKRLVDYKLESEFNMELNNESKTLFIPLYGKALMSKNNLFIKDPKAEEIISKVSFNFNELKQSKWLSMYMAVRAKIIDEICSRYIIQNPNTTVIHLGCGLDSRCLRVNKDSIKWYDIDFESVIDLRKQFYGENERYKMIGKSVTDLSWLNEIDTNNQSISTGTLQVSYGNDTTSAINKENMESIPDELGLSLNGDGNVKVLFIQNTGS